MNNSSNSFDRYTNLKRNFAPANKSGEAGQIVNSVPEHETLSDYICSVRRAEAFDVVAAEKKLTFAEWSLKRYGRNLIEQYVDCDSVDMLECWNAAQDNK